MCSTNFLQKRWRGRRGEESGAERSEERGSFQFPNEPLKEIKMKGGGGGGNI